MKILVLGVGNILFTDEGIGVRAVEWLQKNCDFGKQVEFLDGGTLGTSLLGAMTAASHLIILDAVLGGDKAGSIYKFKGDELRKSLSFSDSLHQTDLVDTLILCDMMGNKPETLVIGMEPQDYQNLGIELTEICQSKLNELCMIAIEEIKQILVKN